MKSYRLTAESQRILDGYSPAEMSAMLTEAAARLGNVMLGDDDIEMTVFRMQSAATFAADFLRTITPLR